MNAIHTLITKLRNSAYQPYSSMELEIDVTKAAVELAVMERELNHWRIADTKPQAAFCACGHSKEAHYRPPGNSLCAYKLCMCNGYHVPPRRDTFLDQALNEGDGTYKP